MAAGRITFLTGTIAFELILAGGGVCQAQETAGKNVPIYRLTVIERTVKAVNYQYRSGPTQIDFRGTVLLPDSKGSAVVESKQGRTEIEAKFDHLAEPARFGAEYLTFVLWAITPDGHAKNLGELLAGSSDKAKVHVSTDMQAFGMIVTAEPYAAVRQPSDVVVMENVVRADTVGKVEPIQAKYELLPRGHYTYDVADSAKSAPGPKVSMSQYEQTVEVYQAQNAVQIAASLGAAEQAGETFTRAQELLRSAQSLFANHADKSQVIATAREAAQTAEDARVITLKRKQDAEVTVLKQEATQEREKRMQAEAEAQTAKAQASANRELLDQERTARQKAEAQASQAAQAAASSTPATEVAPVQTATALAEPAPPAPDAGQPPAAKQQQRALRLSLFQRFNSSEIIDTPRGLVVTISAREFLSNSLQPSVSTRIDRVAEILKTHPGLTSEIDDNSAGMNTTRAEAVRAALLQHGVSATAIDVQSPGNARPITSNSTKEGREQNRRVEIVISGDPIGNMPYWDQSYPVAPR